MNNEHEIVLYQLDNTNVCVNVIFKDETFWLTQKAMAELFDVNVPAISKHLTNIFEDEELVKESTVSKMETVQMEGNRQIRREREFYNLDAIIAVGYRVNSKKATKFRQQGVTSWIKNKDIRNPRSYLLMKPARRPPVSYYTLISNQPVTSRRLLKPL